MAEIADLSVTDANNTGRFPEGQLIPALNNGARALEGILARANKDRSGYLITAGSSTAYTVTTYATHTAYAAGMYLMVCFHVACGDNPTLNVDSIGTKNLKRKGGGAILASDILVNEMCLVAYNSTADILEVIGTGEQLTTVKPWVSLSLANGENSNVTLSAGTNFYISGPTSGFSLTGLTGGVDGREITLYNSVAYAMTLTNDATSTAANRFLTLTGADVATTTQGVFRCVYSATASRWIVTGTQT